MTQLQDTSRTYEDTGHLVNVQRAFEVLSAETSLDFLADMSRYLITASTKEPLSTGVARRLFLVDQAEAEVARIAALAARHEASDNGELYAALATATDALLDRYGSPTVTALRRMYANHDISSVFLSDVLPWIGRSNSPESREERFRLLVDHLDSPEPPVRASAALGLASLGDARAVRYLRQAAARERITMLRRRLEKTAELLAAGANANPP